METKQLIADAEEVARRLEAASDFWPASDIRFDAFRLLRKLSAAIAPSDAAGAPIYQISFSDDDGWLDCGKKQFDTHPAHARRIVYAAHVAPAAPLTDEQRAQSYLCTPKSGGEGFVIDRAPDSFELRDCGIHALQADEDSVTALVRTAIRATNQGGDIDMCSLIAAKAIVPLFKHAAPITVAPAAVAPTVEEADDDYPATPESERAAFNGMMRWHLIRLLQAWRYGGDLRAAGMAAFEWARTNNVGQEAFKASEGKMKLVAPTPTVAAAAIDDLKRAGAPMANTMFNLAQRPGTMIDARLCEQMDQMRRQWDAAVRAQKASPVAADAAAQLTKTQIRTEVRLTNSKNCTNEQPDESASSIDEGNTQAYCDGQNSYSDGSVNHYPFSSREFAEFEQGRSDAQDEAADSHATALATAKAGAPNGGRQLVTEFGQSLTCQGSTAGAESAAQSDERGAQDTTRQGGNDADS